MSFKSVKQILAAIKKTKEVSASELTSNYLERIKKHDDSLNCFISLTEKSAMDKAKKIDKEVSNNKFRALSDSL